MRTGGCMCGAVRYEAETDGRFSVCYCKMCQRWSSGVFMGAPTKGVRITEGQDVLTRVRTSDWARLAGEAPAARAVPTKIESVREMPGFKARRRTRR